MSAREWERECLALRCIGFEILLNGVQVLHMAVVDGVNRGAIVDELRANSAQRLGRKLPVLARLTPGLRAEAEGDPECNEEDLDEQAPPAWT